MVGCTNVQYRNSTADRVVPIGCFHYREHPPVVGSQENWPEWWSWELGCSNPHLVKRMIDRGFSETDLRQMLEAANGYRADVVPGRWVVETTHENRPWEVIVEPDYALTLLVVVTAYAVG